MDISLKKIELIEWIARVEDEKILESIDGLKKKSIKQTYQGRIPGTSGELQIKLDLIENATRIPEQKAPKGSFLEGIEHLSGSVSGPQDLSVSPKHMEGFGS